MTDQTRIQTHAPLIFSHSGAQPTELSGDSIRTGLTITPVTQILKSAHELKAEHAFGTRSYHSLLDCCP